MKKTDYKTCVLLKTHATVKYLIHVQSSVEDTIGSLDSDQRLASMYRLRAAILNSISIKNISQGGNPIDIHEIDQIDYDPINMLSDKDMATASAQLHMFHEALDGKTEDWEKQFLNYILSFEKILGYEIDLPGVRSPNGFQLIINIFRSWDPLLKKLGLPTSIPSEWIVKEKKR